MKNLLMKLITIALLCSCQSNTKVDVSEISDELTYFRDEKTNLCFATINSQSSAGYFTTSITCVPCDSVKYNIGDLYTK